MTFSPTAEAEAQAEHRSAAAESSRKTTDRPRRRLVPAIPATLGGAAPMDLLRIFLGIALAIKGIYFILNMQLIETQLGDGFGNLRNVTAWFVVLANAVGGVSLALGFATRVVSFLNIIVMTGAIVFVHSFDGMFGANSDLQFAIFVLFALVLLLWRGSGEFSMDRLLRGTPGRAET